MDLPSRFAAVLLAFAPVFLQQRTWRHAERLPIGAILAPGKRPVTSLLRFVGLSRERRFVNYHRVLSRAVWDARAASHLLLELLIAAFVPAGPVVLASTTRSSAVAARGSAPRASTATRSAPRRATSSRRAACAGSA
jgi:hypothetical protein